MVLSISHEVGSRAVIGQLALHRRTSWASKVFPFAPTVVAVCERDPGIVRRPLICVPTVPFEHGRSALSAATRAMFVRPAPRPTARRTAQSLFTSRRCRAILACRSRLPVVRSLSGSRSPHDPVGGRAARELGTAAPVRRQRPSWAPAAAKRLRFRCRSISSPRWGAAPAPRGEIT